MCKNTTPARDGTNFFSGSVIHDFIDVMMKIKLYFYFLLQPVVAKSSVFHGGTLCAKGNGQGKCFCSYFHYVVFCFSDTISRSLSKIMQGCVFCET